MKFLIKKLFWSRGAISFKSDNAKDIEDCVIRFFNTFLIANKLKEKDIQSMIVIAPQNLHSCYPASFFRKNGYNFPSITAADIYVENTPQNIIRFMIQVKSIKKPIDLYLDEAKFLKDKIDKLY